MNIAHLLPYSVTYPLTLYNARHSWALQLAQLQAAQGHTVTLYCNPLSSVPGITVRGIPMSVGDKQANNRATLELAFSRDHDIYHSHYDNLHYDVGGLTKKPIVVTQHWWPSDATIALATTYQHNNIWSVPPTKYMYDFDIKHGIATKGYIPHGIDLSLFSCDSVQKNGRLLAVGRISPEKNIETSIAVAKQANMGLDIIGKVVEKNQPYWQELLPTIDGVQIRYLGIKSQPELVHYYAQAQAALFPSDPHEAFGLVAIEAQACGTPVIMSRGGSRNELIMEGATGFLCETVDDYVNAAHKSRAIDPEKCKEFAQAFDVTAMADKYQKLYASLTS